jgi:hypothetical protein
MSQDPRGAALSIEVRIGDHCDIALSERTKSEPLRVRSGFRSEMLTDMRKRTREALEVFRKAAQEPSLHGVAAALAKLRFCGWQTLYQLFDGDSEKLVAASKMCQEVNPLWRRQRCEANSERTLAPILSPGIVEVRTRADYGIPFDMLPLFDLAKPDSNVRNMEDLALLAGGLLGFSAVVNRQIGVPPPDSPILENSPKLPVKMFWFATLTGARRQEEFFRKQSANIELDGPWPTADEPGWTPDSTKPGEELALHLWSSDKHFDGSIRKPPDQILHFCCHCDALVDSPSEYRLRLRRPGCRLWGASEYKVKLEQLTMELGNLRIKNGGGIGPSRGLVFMDACGSAEVEPAAAGTFPDLFVRNCGFKGFIGAEATVPDARSTDFVIEFYRQLLRRPSLGAAIYTARWKMLAKLNPFGILYSLYADPNIAVGRPVEL